jgi:hypothetical protein
MSSNNTDSETPNIDAAKNIETPSSTYFQNIKTFIYSLIKKIFHVFIYIILAAMVLYSCKVAQSGLIPSDTGCKPYEGNDPTIKQVKANIFETLYSDPQMSEKLTIPYEKDNTKNTIIDLIRGVKEKSNVSSITTYFVSIFESVIAFNYSALEIFYNILNKFPEFLTLILGPFLLVFYGFILFIIDHLYFLITWFTQMKWLFKKNLNDTKSGSPEWENISLEFDAFGFGMSVLIAILFVILGFILIPLLMTIGSIAILAYCVFSIVGYNSYLDGKPSGITTIIKGVFSNYKIYISILLSLIVISTAYSVLGSGAGMGAIITVILMYFGIIAINLYNPIPEKNLTVAVPIVEATKVYTAVEEHESYEKGGILGLFGGQKGGSKLSNKLKSFNKLYSKVSKK